MFRKAFAALVFALLVPCAARAVVPVSYAALGTNSPGVAPITTASAATIAVIGAPPSSNHTKIRGMFLVAGGTTNVTLVAGQQTSTPCDTNAYNISGAIPLVANSGFSLSYEIDLPPGYQFCINNGSAVQISGSISWIFK